MSARPVYKELMVNVGVCMTAFYKPGNLADAIMEFQKKSSGGMLHRFAQKLKVTTSHLGYKQTKPLRKIMSTTAKQSTFPCEEFNGEISVEQYFKKSTCFDLSASDALADVHLSPRVQDHAETPQLAGRRYCWSKCQAPYPSATRAVRDLAWPALPRETR